MNHFEGVRVFFAAPYSQLMSTVTGVLDAGWRVPLELMRRELVGCGEKVFHAHFNEPWGTGWLEPEDRAPADFQRVQAADIVYAVDGDPLSGGVAVEIR